MQSGFVVDSTAEFRINYPGLIKHVQDVFLTACEAYLKQINSVPVKKTQLSSLVRQTIFSSASTEVHNNTTSTFSLT